MGLFQKINNNNDVLVQWKMKTPIGPLFLVAGKDGLYSVLQEKQNIPLITKMPSNLETASVLTKCILQLTEYFSGQRKTFSLPLKVNGTEFQKSVWNQLKKIPYGQTCAYKDIAIKINNAKAVRAVGSANGKNQFCIIVPCHRVIASDGSLGGYAGGLKMKIKLLKLENSKAVNRNEQFELF